MADGEECSLTDKDALLQTQKREKRELQGVMDWSPPRNHVDFAQRLSHAQSVPFQLGSTFPAALQQVINVYAASFACHEQAVIFPLLSTCGACMGATSSLEVTSDWQEPPILWTMISVSNRTFSQHSHFIDHLQRKLIALQDELKIMPTFLLEFFDVKALHHSMISNSGRSIGLFSNFATFEDLVNDNRVLVQLLPKLFNGGPWIYSDGTQQGSVSMTCMALSGHADPHTLQRCLYTNCAFAKLVRTVFAVVTTQDQQNTANLLSAQSQLDLKNVFQPLYNIHSSGVKYRFRPDAQQLFVRFRNEFVKKSQSEPSALMSEIFQVAPRLLARLALLLHALETVLEAANWGLVPDVMTWNTEISSETVWSSRLLLDYIIGQKRSLLSPYHTQALTSEPENKVGSSSEVVILSSNEAPIVSARTESITIPPPEGRQSTSEIKPTIVSVTSAGVTLEQQQQQSGIDVSSRGLLPTFKLPPSLSLSLLPRNTPSESAEHIQITPDLSSRPYASPSAEVTCVTPETPSKSYPSHPMETPTRVEMNQEMTSPSFSGMQPEDVDILEEMSSKDFYAMYKSQIFKVLTMKSPCITPSRTVQLKLFRDRPFVQVPFKPKYTCNYARKALYHIEQLGFGILGVLGNGRNVTFQKKRYAELGPEQYDLLQDMCISEKDYEECFNWRPPIEAVEKSPVYSVSLLQHASSSPAQPSPTQSDSCVVEVIE